MTEQDGGEKPGSAGDASSYARPNGVDSSFAPHDPLPAAPPTRHPVSPEVAAHFGKPYGSDDAISFAPLPGERMPPQHRIAVPAVDPETAKDFQRTGGGAEAFQPAPGTRIAPRGMPRQSPWWKPDAATDPWRDPTSPYWLGAPARFVDQRPVAPLDGEPAPEEAPEDEPDEEERDAKVVGRGRFGLGALGLAIVVALVAGAIGGGLGFWFTKHTHDALRDPDIKLATAGSPANRPPGSVADIAKRVGPAVVEIDVRGADEAGTGSGVVIDKAGYILTNNHVVSIAGDDGSIRVVFGDQTAAAAKLVGRDPSTDLAVIKVDHASLTVATLGDSSTLVVGDPVVAIGSPLGLRGTVTTGIVSAVDRPVHVSGEGSDTDAVIDAIQTDAAINPGNSGGALVAADGSVIGINSASASVGSGSGGQTGSIGLGFAIPINEARAVATQLIKTGKVAHASLGASARSVTDGTRLGAYLLQVDPNGPAQKAGLKEGDVIKLVDKQLISTSDDLSVAIQKHKPGEVVTVRYSRGNAENDVRVTLGSV
ncbi:MAG: S1C family serine protease [Jatrophihabitans sp.]